MQSNPKVSVIVPVYKVEKYIKKCVNSIINQTYKNLEIILVDDGSPDKCPQICDDYAEKDSRIKVIHSVNQGVSCARNQGIKASSGEYITFVDSDDWISKYAVSELVSMMQSCNSDFCNGVTTEVGAIHTKRNLDVDRICITKSNITNLITYISKMYTGPWAKLYRRQLLIKNNIEFPRGVKYGEDAKFLYQYLKVCERLCSVDCNVYFYNRIVDESATRKYHAQIHYWVSDNLKELKNILDNSSQSPIWNIYVSKRGIKLFKFCCAHHAALCGDENTAIERIKECCDLFGEYFNDAGENEIIKDSDFQLYASMIKMCDYKGIYDKINGHNTKISDIKNRIRKFITALRTFWVFKIKVKLA